MKLEQLSNELALESLDAFAYHGDKASAARALGISRETLRDRVRVANARGLKSKWFDMPSLGGMVQLSDTSSVGRKHMVIPDGQTKPGVPLEHWSWIGQYMLDKRPDVVVNIGDFADMESLSPYDKGHKSFEGRTYDADIKAARKANELLMAPIKEHNRKYPNNQYHPDKRITLGNHEYRIIRAVDLQRELDGTIAISDLGYEEYGWKVHDYLEVVQIDGVHYSHFFTSGKKGLPVSSARALATKKHVSCTMGHNQTTDVDMSQIRADGKQIIALFSGICYLHDEKFLGPQGNSDKRQIWMCHEVDDGDYDLMQVSLKYLKKRYG